MRLTAALLVLAVFACKPSNPVPPQSAEAPSAADAGAMPPDSKALLAEVDRLKDQLKDRPKSFEVLAALGNLYYENGRYLEAIDSYREALALSAAAEAEEDALLAKKVKPSAELPAQCRRTGTDYGLDQIVAAAKKLDPPKQLRCLQAGLDMAVAARARRGNALYLIGNPEGALAEHQKVLQRQKDYPESLFFVGAILLEQSQGDKAKLEEGKKYWKRLLQVAPDSPRAPLVRDSLPKAEEIFAPKQPGQVQGQMPPGHPPVAGDDAQPQQGQLPPGHPDIRGGMKSSEAQSDVDPEAMKNMQEAVANTERTPELEKGLDELVSQSDTFLDQGKYQEARDAVVRVMPMRPNDAHTAANLGGAMRGLGRLDMAERTLSMALQVDPKQPRALYEMAKLDAQKGDKAQAIERLKTLKSADPKFAKAHDVDGELRKLQ